MRIPEEDPRFWIEKTFAFFPLNMLCLNWLPLLQVFWSFDFLTFKSVLCVLKKLFRFLPAFFYCLTTSTSPQGPYSLISTTSSGYTRRRRSYVTPLSLSFKPGADDLEIPAQHHLRHSFLSSLWTFVGISFCRVHPSPSLRRQTSRNETRFCHRGRGGALSAVLTCTGKESRTRWNFTHGKLNQMGRGGSSVFSAKSDSREYVHVLNQQSWLIQSSVRCPNMS